MQDFTKKKIVLGVCGGVAAYKTAYLIRDLTALGADVRVVMTDSAKSFIQPILMQALSGNEVRGDLFDASAERAMGHIELARWADYVLIAPASANCLAKMAQGLGDDLLTTLYLVAETPIIVCPAMNRSMWSHPATVHNCETLKKRGVVLVGPEEGAQACGEFGLGRMSEPSQIINALRLLNAHQLLVGKRVLITAGPTREPIDPVRYLSNYSSGKMGFAMAEACLMAGSEVCLVSGPTNLQTFSGIRRINVESADEMYQAVQSELTEGDIFIGAAAVADYRVETLSTNKVKKTSAETLQVSFVKNPDILTWVASSNKASFVVGFAAETTDVLSYAKEKMQRKQLDMIVANKVGKGMGFESDVNEVTVLTKTNQYDVSLNNKTRVAAQIIEILAACLHNDASLFRQG